MSKSMPLADLTLLKKVMGLTFSEQDGEALVAIRKANGLLKKSGLTWTDIFERTVGPSVIVNVEPVGEPKVAQESTLEEQIQHAFDTLRGVPLGSYREFIDSLEEQFKDNKYLSPKQRDPLFKTYRDHKRKMKE